MPTRRKPVDVLILGKSSPVPGKEPIHTPTSLGTRSEPDQRRPSYNESQPCAAFFRRDRIRSRAGVVGLSSQHTILETVADKCRTFRSVTAPIRRNGQCSQSPVVSWSHRRRGDDKCQFAKHGINDKPPLQPHLLPGCRLSAKCSTSSNIQRISNRHTSHSPTKTASHCARSHHHMLSLRTAYVTDSLLSYMHVKFRLAAWQTPVA